MAGLKASDGECHATTTTTIEDRQQTLPQLSSSNNDQTVAHAKDSGKQLSEEIKENAKTPPVTSSSPLSSQFFSPASRQVRMQCNYDWMCFT